MNGPAAITGIGLITSAGLGRASNWTTVCAARHTAATTPDFLSQSPVRHACLVPHTFDAERLLGRRTCHDNDRCAQLALLAARAAIKDAGLSPRGWDGARVGVAVGTSAGGVETLEENHTRLRNDGPHAVRAMFLPKSLINMISGVLSIELGARGPNMVVCTACASGATALGVGLGWLRQGVCDIVVAGGTDACVTPLYVAGFAKLAALDRQHPPRLSSRPFDKDHSGFVIAEGACMFTLERPADAAARRARVWARLAGHGTTADAHHITAPHPDGAGSQAAMLAACRDASIIPSDVGHVNAHATSTPLGDVVEASLIGQVCPHAAVTSTKGVTGHALGAAGAIEAAYTALALYHQVIPPTANHTKPCQHADQLDIVTTTPRRSRFDVALSNSFGFGGHNAVLALTTA